MAGGQALLACSNFFHTELQGLLLKITEDTINMFNWRLRPGRSRKASERAWICRELFGYRQPQAMSEVSCYCAHDQLLQSICRYARVAAERLPNELGCAGNSSVIGNPKPCRKFRVTVRMISCYNQYVVTLGSQPKGFRTSLVVPKTLRLSATRSQAGSFMFPCFLIKQEKGNLRLVQLLILNAFLSILLSLSSHPHQFPGPYLLVIYTR